MKDKQTKRIEARARLLKGIELQEREIEQNKARLKERTAAIKNKQPSSTRSLAEAKADILSLSERDALRSLLERLENQLNRSKRELQALSNIISNERTTYP